MAIVGAIFVLIVLVIGGIRAMNSLLDIWWSRDTAVWASYLIIGAVFCIAGMLLMRRRHPQD
jgi:NADH:ubiquinone oxidoreductase subunit 6 (subunit J)